MRLNFSALMLIVLLSPPCLAIDMVKSMWNPTYSGYYVVGPGSESVKVTCSNKKECPIENPNKMIKTSTHSQEDIDPKLVALLMGLMACFGLGMLIKVYKETV